MTMTPDTRETLFRLLADVVLYADLEELPFPALRTAYGDDYVAAACAEPHDDGTLAKCHVAEALLRLAQGHALPKNLGLRDELIRIQAILNIDPNNDGGYEP